jgi:hypothetical protein
VKTSGNFYESDPVLSDLTEAALRELFGSQRIESPAAAIAAELGQARAKNHVQSERISSTATRASAAKRRSLRRLGQSRQNARQLIAPLFLPQVALFF